MQVILEYLNTQLNDLENERMSKESLLNSKIIEANEIKKAVSKLTLNDNDTYNIFNASGSKIGFQNREVVTLKEQEDNLRIEADNLAEEIKEINLKIESLAITIAHANSCNSKIKSLNNEVIRLNGEVAMYSTGGKKAKSKKKEEDLPIVEENVNLLLDNVESVETAQENITLSGNVEMLDINMDNNKFLEEISDRVFFVSRILKFDPLRVRLELDEIYKAIIKYINK